MRHLLAAFTLLVFSASLAPASTYQWRDDNGVTHFTDDSDRIPARYLGRARELDSIRGEKKPATPAKAQDLPAAVAAPAASAADDYQAVRSEEKEQLEAELKSLQAGLATKKKELDRLHHKWSVVKGRTPTEKEVEEFEKKRAEGKATFKDNPYVNKKPLSSPGPARSAYFKKLEEIRRDEEKVRQLEQQLQGLR